MSGSSTRTVLLLMVPLALCPPAQAATTAADVMAFVSKPEHRQIVNAMAVDALKKLQQCDSGSPQSTAPPEAYDNFGPLGVDVAVDHSPSALDPPDSSKKSP